MFTVRYELNWVFPYTALTNDYITETERIYCAVRTESLNTIQVNLDLEMFKRIFYKAEENDCITLKRVKISV